MMNKINILLLRLGKRTTFLWFVAMFPISLLSQSSTFTTGGIKYYKIPNSPNHVMVMRKNPAYSGHIIIPSQVVYEGNTYFVTQIDNRAFYDCVDLLSVELPSSIKIIGYEAFYNCKGLNNIVLPEQLQIISNRAFVNCTGLTSIFIPKSTMNISPSAFNGSISLYDINVDDENPYYSSYDGALYNGNYFYLRLYPEGKNTIAFHPYMDIIDKQAFAFSKDLVHLTLPNSVTQIQDRAFAFCDDLTSITLPQNLFFIGAGAFFGCKSLASVHIPDSIQTLKAQAFESCDDLTDVYIGKSISEIGGWAFKNCKSLQSITCCSMFPPALGSEVFIGTPSNLTIYVPTASIPLYQGAEQFNAFAISGSSFCDQLYGINHVALEEIKLFPNPFFESLGFDVPQDSFPLFFELFDHSGKKIYEMTVNTNQVHLPFLSSGIYFIRLSNQKNIYTGKVVKSN